MPPNDLIEANRHIAMMQDPDRWPIWPKLPLKRPAKDGGFPETAYLLELGLADIGQEPRIVCKRGNGLAPHPDDPEIEFESFTDLWNDGWAVD